MQTILGTQGRKSTFQGDPGPGAGGDIPGGPGAEVYVPGAPGAEVYVPGETDVPKKNVWGYKNNCMLKPTRDTVNFRILFSFPILSYD